MNHLMQPGMGELPIKKKRGRPKKIRPDGTVAVKAEQPPRPPPLVHASTSSEYGLDGGPPKKKRGRPKKIRATATDAMLPVSSSSSSSIATQLDMNGSVGSNGSHHSLPETGPPSASPAPSVYMNNHQAPPQQHGGGLPMDYYGRSPSNGPLSGLCNDSTSSLGRQSNPSPCQSATNTSPRQPDGPPSLIPLVGPSKAIETAVPTATAVQPPPQESHIERVVESSAHPFTPPMSFRPTPPASGIGGYHTHNQVFCTIDLKVLCSLFFKLSFHFFRMWLAKVCQGWNLWWTKFLTWQMENNNNSSSSNNNNMHYICITKLYQTVSVITQRLNRVTRTSRHPLGITHHIIQLPVRLLVLLTIKVNFFNFVLSFVN